MYNYTFLKTLRSARIRLEISRAKHFQHIQIIIIIVIIIIIIIIIIIVVIIIVCLIRTTQVLY
jgi:hypothetical protein